MDLVLNKENGTTLLINTGSKILTDSPVSEKHSDESDLGEKNMGYKEIPIQNLLDKSFSIDETELATPLEPIQAEYFLVSSSNGPLSDESTSESSGKTDNENCYVEENIEDDSKIEIEEKYTSDNETLVHNDLCKCEDEILKDIISNNEKKNISEGLDIIPEKNLETEVLTGKQQQISFASILRGNPSKYDASSHLFLNNNNNRNKNVTFPKDKSQLISYSEPDDYKTWTIEKELSAEEILQMYQDSCKKHQTIELDAIKSQINDIKNNTNHSATLKLHSIKITYEVNETVEDMLKVTNFHTLILHDCKFTPETMNEFLNMLEFYDSVCQLEIEMIFEDDDIWKTFCLACTNIKSLESLSFKKMFINESYMRALLNAVRNNSNITILKFDSCILVKLPSFYLVESLMTNQTIRELYLPSTGLYTKEAEVIARFLMNNTHLKVLDISNNFIGDRGLESLAKGLCTQNKPGIGISALIIFNNQISERSGPIIGSIIKDCKNLHTFNIGFNNLTDEVLKYISLSLPYTYSLEGLGLQCTLLTCKGLDSLAEALPRNKSLRKINFRGNKAIQINGVEKLCQALTSSKITKIEIDENNRSCSDPEVYSQLVKKLHAICTVNRSFTEPLEEQDLPDLSLIISRKLSLSCEPRYIIPESTFQVGSPRLSPIPSPVSSPGPKSRFQIIKVTETSCSHNSVSPRPNPSPKSRFHVTRVPPSPDEEVSLGRFANVRSSVSSNDSMDSLTMLHLDSDSE